MPAAANKALKLSADVSLHAVSCPGVWLPNRGRCSLSLCLLGFHTRSNFLTPAFPLLFHERFRFVRTFVGVRSLGALEAVLERETVYLELVQEEGGGGGGEAVLAVFEGSVRDLLFPAPSHRTSYSGMDLDLLMEPTRDFPGIISPKVEVSTQCTVQETRSPLHDCSTDNVSFGHSSDGGTKGSYHVSTAAANGGGDELQAGERREPDLAKARPIAPASPVTPSTPGTPARGGLSSRHRSRSEGNLTDIPYGQLASRYGGARTSPAPRTAAADDAHNATVSDLGPDVCQHCDGWHSTQSCTTCRLYRQYFPHSADCPHPRRVLHQPPVGGARSRPRSRARKRYLTHDLRWRARSPGSRPQRPSSAPPAGRRLSQTATGAPTQSDTQRADALHGTGHEDDEDDPDPEEDSAPHHELGARDLRSSSSGGRLCSGRRASQRPLSLYDPPSWYDPLDSCCCFCCSPPASPSPLWCRPFYDRPYSSELYTHHDYNWPLRWRPPWYSRYRF